MRSLPPKQADIFAETVERMKSLGVYRKEFDGQIEIYAQLCEQYVLLTERFEESGFEVETETQTGGKKKHPIVATLEGLRKDILSYSDRLCLNPKSFESLGLEPPKRDFLAEALKELGE